MKKIIPFVIIVLIVVIGVIFFLVLNKSKDSSELEESIGKAQLVEVYDYDTNELLKTYENKEDIESLINNLGLDKWKLDKEPNDDTKKYLLKMYQEPTKTVVENSNNEMEEVANIVVYASGEYVEFTAMGMEMSFKTNKNIVNLFETNDL